MEGKEIKDKKAFNIVEDIPSTDEIDEYYSIEDFGNLLIFQTCLSIIKGEDILLNPKKILNKECIMAKTVIRVNFQEDGKLKEVFMEKRNLNKIYLIYKIYSENNKFIKILINKFENYEADEMLTKVNNRIFFKNAFKTYFNIDEFPIKSYKLEEKKVEKKDNEADEIEKEFILKVINDYQNNENQNIMNNNINMEFQNFSLKNHSNNLLNKKKQKISIKNEISIDDKINADNKNEMKEFPESKINNEKAINSEIKLELNKMNSILFQDDDIINEVHNHNGGNESIDEFNTLSEILKYSNFRIVLDTNKDYYGTGFFSRIFLSENKYIKVLFTCYHVINQEYISSHDNIILEFSKNIKITLNNLQGRRKWTNSTIDYTCIEILDADPIFNYLDIDKNMSYSSIFNEYYINEGIIIFGIMKKNNKYYQGFDFGIILKYINNRFYSNYNSDPGSSGGAILLKKNHKLIGIHKGGKYSDSLSMKVNGVIPINVILEDMKINLEFQQTELDSDLPSLMQKCLLENNNEPCERLFDLLKNSTFYLKCKNCGHKYGNKEYDIEKLGVMKDLDKNYSALGSCENCGKTDYEYVIPYKIDVKCLECGNIILEKCPLSINIYMYFANNLKRFKPCNKCGKQNYTIALRKDDDDDDL